MKNMNSKIEKILKRNLWKNKNQLWKINLEGKKMKLILNIII